jgi:hypothetical protein
VLKASHGCGWNLFVHSREAEQWDDIERIAERWLRTTYGMASMEWAYSLIQPRLLVEPYLTDLAHTDYKIFVFGGIATLVQVNIDREQEHHQYFFDRQWTRQTFEYVCPGTAEDVPPPQSLERMLWAAERLGAPFPFVRVDLYETSGKPLFGEMTFYPNAARIGFNPETVDLDLGRLWPL